MAKRRDYAVETARRNAKAQALGWRSYSAKRYAQDKLKRSSLELKAKWGMFLQTKGLTLTKEEQDRAFRAFWQGIADPRTNTDVGIDSPKAEWFVEWDEAVPDYETWRIRYVDK